MNTSHADFCLWLRLPYRGVIQLPVHDTTYRKAREAPLCNAVQITMDADGEVGPRVLSDVTERDAAEWMEYQLELEDIALDFGLSTLFASSEGDLLGRCWLTRLRQYLGRREASHTFVEATGWLDAGGDVGPALFA